MKIQSGSIHASLAQIKLTLSKHKAFIHFLMNIHSFNLPYNKGNLVIINLDYTGKVNTHRLENLVIKFQQTGSDLLLAEL